MTPPAASSQAPEAFGAEGAPRVLTLVGMTALAAALWAVFYYSNFTHLWAPDAMKFAQAARNFLEGGGFDRDEVWPMSLATGGALDAQTQAILHPLVIAVISLLAGRGDGIAALAGGIFFILSAPLVYVLARRLFGVAVGALALVLYLAEPWMLYYSVSGLSEPLFMFLLLSFFALLAHGGMRGRRLRYAVAGVLLGLAYLARPVAAVLIPPALAYAYFDRKSGERRIWAPAVLLAVSALVVVAALSAVGGLGEVASERNSFHLLSNTPEYPGHTYVRSIIPVSFWDHLRSYPDAHLKKWIHQMGVMGRTFFDGFLNPLLTALLLAFPLIWGRGGKAMGLFLLLGAMILLQMALAALTMPATRYLHPFVPMAIPFASASLMLGLRRLLPGRDGPRAAIVLLVAVLASYPFAYTAPIDRGGVVSRDYSAVIEAKDFTSLGELIREHTSEGDVILCDAPWIAAWYGNRTSIWLPNSPHDVTFLKMVAEVKWLFLAEEYELPRAWRLLFDGIAAGRQDGDWEFVIGIEDDGTRGHLFRARSGTPSQQ